MESYRAWKMGRDGGEKGLQVTSFSCLSETPLTLAAQTEGSVEVIRTLCLGGAHIDFRARDGMTALHKAACARHCLALTVRLRGPPTPTVGPSLFFPLFFLKPQLFGFCKNRPSHVPSSKPLSID